MLILFNHDGWYVAHAFTTKRVSPYFATEQEAKNWSYYATV